MDTDLFVHMPCYAWSQGSPVAHAHTALARARRRLLPRWRRPRAQLCVGRVLGGGAPASSKCRARRYLVSTRRVRRAARAAAAAGVLWLGTDGKLWRARYIDITGSCNIGARGTPILHPDITGPCNIGISARYTDMTGLVGSLWDLADSEVAEEGESVERPGAEARAVRRAGTGAGNDAANGSDETWNPN